MRATPRDPAAYAAASSRPAASATAPAARPPSCSAVAQRTGVGGVRGAHQEVGEPALGCPEAAPSRAAARPWAAASGAAERPGRGVQRPAQAPDRPLHARAIARDRPEREDAGAVTASERAMFAHGGDGCGAPAAASHATVATPAPLGTA